MKNKRNKVIKILIVVLIIGLFCIFNTKYTKGYTKEEIVDGIVLNKEIEYIDLGYNYYILDIEFSESDYIVYGYVVVNISDESEIKYPYIAFYENDELKWYKIEFDIPNGKINDCKFLNDKIIVCGEYGKDKTNSFIYCYSNDGNLYKHKIYNLNRNINIYKLYIYNENIYIVGKTNSSDMLYKKGNNSEIFVAKLNEQYIIEDITYHGNNGNNEYIDSILFNNEIVMLIKIVGDGYYDYYSNTPYILTTTSFRMELSGYEKIDYNGNFNLKTDGKSLYIFYLDKVQSKIFRYKYDESLTNKAIEIVYTNDKNPLIFYYDISYDNINNLWVYSINYRNNSYFANEYYIKNSNNEIKTMFDFNENNNIVKYFTRFNNGFIYEGGGIIGGSNHGIYLYKKAKLYFQVNNNIDLNNIDLFANGVAIKSNELIIDKPFNDNIYGYYNGNKKYKFGNEVIEITGKYLIPLNINIEKNSEYNKGLILYFNGDGVLNDKQINSGYKVEEVGNYVLEIYGEDIVTYYYFKVDDMQILEKNNDYKKLEIVNENLNNNFNNDNDKYLNLDFSEYKDTNNKLDNYYLYLIIAIVLGVAIGVFPIIKNGLLKQQNK